VALTSFLPAPDFSVPAVGRGHSQPATSMFHVVHHPSATAPRMTLVNRTHCQVVSLVLCILGARAEYHGSRLRDPWSSSTLMVRSVEGYNLSPVTLLS